MAITANAGPYVSFGSAAAPPNGAAAQDSNPNTSPSLFTMGDGILDPRYPFTYQPGGGNSRGYGWLGTNRIPVLDYVPAAKAVAAIAAANTVTTGVAMTLVSASGAGIVVGQTITNAATGTAVTGLLAMGIKTGNKQYSTYGLRIWDPATMIARTVAITSSATANPNGTTNTITVAGYDVYGYPMSEAIIPVQNTQVAGKKAFKYIVSATPNFTDTTGGHTYSVDTTDVIGLGLRADSFAYLDIYYGNPATPANNLVTAATGFLPAVATAATTTSGDTRGTYALQSATDGTKVLQIFVSPSVANIGTAAGLTGVTQA